MALHATVHACPITYYPRFAIDKITYSLQEELKKEFLNSTVPEGLKKVEKLFIEFNNGKKDCFLVGQVWGQDRHQNFISNSSIVFFPFQLTVADLAFMTFCDFLLPMKADLLACVPALSDLYKRVRELPKIKAWVEKRPQTQF